MRSRVLGVIGGSGIYEINGLQDAKWQTVDTPWGSPSDQILTGNINGVKMAFLPRHGRGHTLSPSTVPYCANIDALKRLGVSDLVSISACGSFREEMAPGDFVIVDQFIDRTFAREKSFFGSGCVAHVSMAYPTCARLSKACFDVANEAGIPVHSGGTYLAMEGPQFSTLAESRMYRESWGADLIGMTNMPEAKLAREAEICYATVAMVTDYDCWHPGHDAVTVEQIVKVLLENADKARELVKAVSPLIHADPEGLDCECKKSLEFALITQPESRDPRVVSDLDAVAGRVL